MISHSRWRAATALATATLWLAVVLFDPHAMERPDSPVDGLVEVFLSWIFVGILGALALLPFAVRRRIGLGAYGPPRRDQHDGSGRAVLCDGFKERRCARRDHVGVATHYLRRRARTARMLGRPSPPRNSAEALTAPPENYAGRRRAAEKGRFRKEICRAIPMDGGRPRAFADCNRFLQSVERSSRWGPPKSRERHLGTSSVSQISSEL